MKLLVVFVGLVISCASIVANASPFQTEKKSCMMGTGSMAETKENLLLQAKREATSELFGELITSYSAVEGFELIKDSITSSSAGYVRIDGSPIYSNGQNLGEVCVAIQAYVTKEDLDKFKPVVISNKQCVSDGLLSVSAIKKHAEEYVVTTALINYAPKLKGKGTDELFKLAHNIKYTESGFIPDTSTYCARFNGVIYPVELEALSSSYLRASKVNRQRASSESKQEQSLFINRKLIESRGWKLDITTNCLDKGSVCASANFEKLKCGGGLIYRGQVGNDYKFDEAFNYGNCVKGCQLLINKSGTAYQEICNSKVTGSGILSNTIISQPVRKDLSEKFGVKLVESRGWKLDITTNCLDKGSVCASANFEKLKCGGGLIYRGQVGNDYKFDEAFNYGNCVKGCQLLINKSGTAYQEICNGKVTGSGALAVN